MSTVVSDLTPETLIFFKHSNNYANQQDCPLISKDRN